MPKSIFTDYDGFVDKFKPKKTTDDCYTPPEVYDEVLKFVRKNYGIADDVPIVRPFYPGGDFENYDYPEGCVVVDNPPFSIFSYIMRWYIKKGIKFFLFGPQLTIAGSDIDVTFIICNTQVTYANGAVVNTSFATNLDSEYRFWCCPELARNIEKVQKDAKQKGSKLSPKFDRHVTSSALLGKIVDHGIDFKIKKEDCTRIRKCGNYTIFGSGYLMNDATADAYNEARRQADEARRQADEARRQADEARRQIIPLELQQEEWIRLHN